jgi:hypothetical protein
MWAPQPILSSQGRSATKVNETGVPHFWPILPEVEFFDRAEPKGVVGTSAKPLPASQTGDSHAGDSVEK